MKPPITTKTHWPGTICWLIPLCFFSNDANAWGLFTHVYFAQSLLLATPLLDDRFRRIIRQFPELVMAGACLPDLAVISKGFNTTHQWQKAEYLLNHARTDEQIAVALGYANHLYVDVIAHHHFVPAHEALWQNESIYTHIACEWAMDAHIQKSIMKTPGQLLAKYADIISPFIAPCFGHATHVVRQKLKLLAYADRLLRIVKLPDIIYSAIKFNNETKNRQFDYYINTTLNALDEFQKVTAGYRPHWEPELTASTNMETRIKWRLRCLQELHVNHEIPIQYYSGTR